MRCVSGFAGSSSTSSVKWFPDGMWIGLPAPTLPAHSRKPHEVTCRSRSLSAGTRTGSVELPPLLRIVFEGLSFAMTVTSTPEMGAPVRRFVRSMSRKPAGAGRWTSNSASGCSAVSLTSGGFGPGPQCRTMNTQPVYLRHRPYICLA